jgi:hypothetical protein
MKRHFALSLFVVSFAGAAHAASPAPPASSPRALSAVATAADSGGLVVYPAKAVQREAFGKRHAVDISEMHAIHAVASRALNLRAPNGQLLRLAYDRHVEHGDGNWTWFGHDDRGADVVITFGEHAVFGMVPQGARQLLLTTGTDGTWLVDVNTNAAEAKSTVPDFAIPEQTATRSKLLGLPLPLPLPLPSPGEDPVADTRIDVIVGYTPGLVARYGGTSQVVTRIQYIIDVANQAMVRSLVNGSINLRATLPVTYPDNTTNLDTLNKLTGTSSVAVDPAFTALRAAREQYGADLVALVRPYMSPEQGNCGNGWLNGANLATFSSNTAKYGYAALSDGTDNDSGSYCADRTYAHETGHNLGQQHNIEDAGTVPTPGAHLYSYGYRELSSTGFATIMGYPLSGQTRILYYGNPNVMDAASGRVTGVPLVNDNAMSLNQTIPLVAQFRPRVP